MAEPQRALDAGERLRRLLAVLAYLAQVGESTITELAHRFGLDRTTLVKELELAACCGLPPYTPDQLLELVIDDERVIAFGLDVLHRPPRLTPDEGFAVAAAARALSAMSASDASTPLNRALAKLEDALGSAQVSVEIDQSPFFTLLREAATNGELVEIDYLGARRGEETTRTVMAYAVVAREGRFYLDAFCHLADDWRRFQLDRISDVRPTGKKGEPRTPPPEMSGTRAFAGGSDVATAYVSVPADKNVLVERFASGPGERTNDGHIVIPVEVADEDFLGRLMLQLGPTAVVVAPDDLADVRKRTATRILQRYAD